MTTRYGQLTYTSLEAVGRLGGWQVKETAGGLTAAEADLLVSRIHIALNPIEQLPRYPTPDQLRAIPRRLAFHRVDDDTAAYWHTVPAGYDSTGRPGNVFAHALLDRDAANTAGAYRPIELWRSSRWLTPYGRSAVSAAVLPADVPGSGGVVTAESVIRFACDTDTWRLGTLCGLLDAVAAALDGGSAVVLGVESVETAAQWIGAVSFLTSPGTARRLNFSTFDRSFDLRCARQVGCHLLAVPRADLDDVPPGLVVIDEADTLWVGEMDGRRHRTPRGQQIEVTAWSAMAQVALTHPAYATELCADIDEFASQVVDIGLAPSLPMAVSVLNRSWGEDAVAEARSVIDAQAGAAQWYWSS